MRFAVRYYTKTGNTKRLAEAIANELGVEALPISEPVKGILENKAINSNRNINPGIVVAKVNFAC